MSGVNGDRAEPGSSEPFALRLGEEGGAVRQARQWVADRLEGTQLGELSHEAQVLVSELVTNALLHAGPPAEVQVRVDPRAVRVEVSDHNPLAPVPSPHSTEAMTGRGLQVIEGLAHDWGVEPRPDGKAVWAELRSGDRKPRPELGEEELFSIWGDDLDAGEDVATERHFTVRLGRVPTGLLLEAKAHVDNLVREFTLAASGARTGTTAAVPEQLARLIETVVNRFAEARLAMKTQALAAARRGLEHVDLELELPVSAADAGEEYLRALDEADAYCRAARLLTLESPARHRLFRHWYIEEVSRQLRSATAGNPTPGQTFEQRALAELDAMAEETREAEQGARLGSLAAALTNATTPEAVSQAVLTEGVAALGSSGGRLVLAADGDQRGIGGVVRHGEAIPASLESETVDAALPAATVLGTGQAVWLESPQERDDQFPELANLDPGIVSLCAVPLQAGERLLGALQFSFAQARLFDDLERTFVQAMAALTAQALDRTVLYQQRLDTARRLQRSLLPPRTAEVPGATVTTAYQPFGDGLDVGGAFFDVWACNGDRWAIAVGDVCGEGPEAAAVTTLARHTLRALTMTGTGVVAAIELLNRAVLDAAESSSNRACTAVLGLVETVGDELRIDLGSGGHPGPLVFRRNGSIEEVVMSGSLLGVVATPSTDRRTLHLRPGDEIVLFTNGVTETRGRDGTPFGSAGVVDAVRAGRRSGTPTARAVEEAVLRHGLDQVDDDLAVLALRVE